MKKAKWIGCDPSLTSPVICRVFSARGIKKASIDVCGLGFFELRLNGKKVSRDLMTPAVTDYCERDLSTFGYPIFDKLSHRALYLTYDLTNYLSVGDNKLEIHLGCGWFRQRERTAEGDVSFDDTLRAIYALRLTDKEGAEFMVCSDGTELCRPSKIVYNNLFTGEIWDYSEKSSRWQPVSLLDFSVPLQKQACPADRVIRKIKPILLGRVDGRYIYDAGENISGLVEVTGAPPVGEKLILRYSELLDENGALDFRTTGAWKAEDGTLRQVQRDEFIGDGQEHNFCPMFVYHAFRYFDVQGEITCANVLVIHSDVPVSSEFVCSSETLNWLFSAYLLTQLNNMHGGVPSDCPHRERLGYTGDGQVCAESAMLMLDSKEFYKKWIDDILDCQCTVSGHVQHTAPFMGGGGGPGGWGGAIVFVPYSYYKRFGDISMLKKTYPAMQRFVEYMKSRSSDYLVSREEEGGWCLGDWASLPKMELPEPFVNTCLFIKCLKITNEIAAVLKQPKIHEDYIKKATAAVLKEYYNSDTALCCGGKQGANAFAVDAGLFEDNKEPLNALAEYYENLNELDTGFIGTDILLDVLCKNGYENLGAALLTNENPGSFYTMKAAGSTTVWEYFDTRASLNHPMFGAAARQLFTCILGINQKTAGFKEIIIKPCFVKDLTFARGFVELDEGKLSVSWERKQGDICLEIFTPKPCTLVLSDKEQELKAGANKVVVRDVT